LTKIFFVCHPEISDHVHGRGFLTSQGTLHAKSLRAYLKAEKFESVYVSPFPYTKQTASILTAGRHIEIHNHVLIRALDFGVLEKMLEHFLQSDSTVISEWWKNQEPNMIFPGGENLESLRRRVKRFITQMADRHDQKSILVVSHKSTIAMVSLISNQLDNESFFNVENWPYSGSSNLLEVNREANSLDFQIGIS